MAGGAAYLRQRARGSRVDEHRRELIPGELDRSEPLEIFEGETLPVVSRVDAAASKLVWISKGSHKSRRDLRAIYRQSSDEQQQAIKAWADQSGHAALLGEVLQELDELQ
jgi:hypothetical protein